LAEGLVASPDRVPAMIDADRKFLSKALGKLKSDAARGVGREQVLHGEPHSDNLLRTREGLLFTDFEACCRGPVEFDVADVPEEIETHYRGLDTRLLQTCRLLVLAMVATWCWAGYDDHENLRRAAPQLLDELRAGYKIGA